MKTEISPCSYDHDGVKDLSPHTIRTCPILHMYCGWCFMRGHDPSAHQIRRYTQRELRQRFLQDQSEGVLTSILLLAHRPKGAEQMISAQWRFGLLGQSYRRDAVSRFHLRIPVRVQLGFDKIRIEKDGEERSEALKEKVDLVSFNSSLENPLAAVPVRRYLIEEEVNKRRREEKEKLTKTSVWSRLGPEPTGGEKSLAVGESSPPSYRHVRLDDDSEDSGSEVWIDAETLTVVPH